MADTEASGADAAAGVPPGALDFLRRAPVLVTAQAYRGKPFTDAERQALMDHLDSWRRLLARHGIKYDGILADGGSREHPQLLYHVSLVIDGARYPAGLPLVLDALYDLVSELRDMDWELFGVEEVVTRLLRDESSRSLIAGERLFPQQFLGTPSPQELGGPF